jgi:hypothetical protein
MPSNTKNPKEGRRQYSIAWQVIIMAVGMKTMVNNMYNRPRIRLVPSVDELHAACTCYLPDSFCPITVVEQVCK